MNTNNAEPKSGIEKIIREFEKVPIFGVDEHQRMANAKQVFRILLQSYGEQKYQQGREEMKKEMTEKIMNEDFIEHLTSLSTEDTKK